MLIIAEKQPVKPLLVIPLNELTEFTSHKEKLFAGVSHHICEEQPHAVKLHIVVARHFVYKTALAVYNLVMAYRQDEILAESIEEAEGDTVVITLAEKRVHGCVTEHIVHPAHIPLEIEAETADVSRHCNHRPCR